MNNNGFSHFSCLRHSTSTVPNTGESRYKQNVEQGQQATFSVRPTAFCDPANPYLRSQSTSRGINLGLPRRTTVIKDPANPNLTVPPFLTVTGTSQPITRSSATSGPATIDPPEDPFAALVAYQATISFEGEQPQLYGGFDSFRVQPSGQTTHVPVMGNSPVLYDQGVDSLSQGQSKASTQTALETVIKFTRKLSHVSSTSFQKEPQGMRQVSRQDNPSGSYQGSYQRHASAPAPSVMLGSGSVPLSPVQPIIGSFYPSLQQTVQSPPEKTEKPDSCQGQALSPPPWVIAKVQPRCKSKQRPADKYLFRTNSTERPYMCGYLGCGKTFKRTGHLRSHVFDHTHVSEYKCLHPECGLDSYFNSVKDLNRHIKRVHWEGKQEWTCAFCHRRFASRSNLTVHAIKEHSNHPR